MKVADILRIKGSTVKTVTPDKTALQLSEQLRDEQIGAAIVSDNGKSIDGIISERDLAYGLAAHGRCQDLAVSELMTKVVIVCSPEDSVTDVMKLMTERRTRLSKTVIGPSKSSASATFSSTGSARCN